MCCASRSARRPWSRSRRCRARRFAGRVAEIGASALPVSGTGAAAREFRWSSGSTSRTRLRPGLTCDAEIVTAERADVLTVPLQSVVLRTIRGGRIAGRVSSPRPASLHAGDAWRHRRARHRGRRRADGTPVVTGPYQALRELQDGALGADVNRQPVTMTVRRRLLVAGRSERIAPIRHPLRALLAALAMAAAVATTAIVQTALEGLARSARDAAPGPSAATRSSSHEWRRATSAGASSPQARTQPRHHPRRRAVSSRVLRTDRVDYAATAQRPADVVAGRRRFESASINGTQAGAAGRFATSAWTSAASFTREEDIRRRAGRRGRPGIVDPLFPAAIRSAPAGRIANRAFRIVGIQARQGTAGGVSLDHYVWMPLAAFERAFGAAAHAAGLRRGARRRPTLAARRITRASRCAPAATSAPAPRIRSTSSRRKRHAVRRAITERIGRGRTPISLMALLAAIVVVANTTLVSVTQRTHEIGIRRALGASRSASSWRRWPSRVWIALLGGRSAWPMAAGGRLRGAT